MKISYLWLRDLAKLPAGPLETAKALTSIGHAVDTVSKLWEDHIFDLDITSNRPDCLCAIGLARELAANYGTNLHVRPTPPVEEGQRIENLTTVVVDAPDLCPRYCARVLTSVKIGESPAWLRSRVEAHGFRSINNVVDVTNFVMLEVGHPVHAFDLDRLAGHMIRVRKAKAGERLKTLDGVERLLDPDVLVIADQKEPVALAGIMGGELSEISAGTTRILLESALFDPMNVRRSSKRLSLRTEASARFEKGCDPEAPPRAADRVCHLLQEMGCVVARGYLDVKSATPPPSVIDLKVEEVRALLGVEIDAVECARFLDLLGFTVKIDGTESLQARVPTHRVDVGSPVDLIEEIARFHGYDRIPAALPPLDSEPLPLPAHLALEEDIRDFLVGAGLTEVITYSFVQPPADPSDMVPLRNAISERTHLRSSLSAGMRETALHNINNGHEDFRFFELGHVFRVGQRESAALGILVSGGAPGEPTWRGSADRPGFFEVKGIIEELFERVAAKWIAFRRREGTAAAEISAGGAVVGWIEPLKIDGKHPAYLAEINLDALALRIGRRVDYTPVVRFPASWRDVSFLVDESTEYASVVKAVADAGGGELVSVALIDLFRGDKLPGGKKSMTLRLRYQSAARTLTSVEVDELHARCVEAIATLGSLRR